MKSNRILSVASIIAMMTAVSSCSNYEGVDREGGKLAVRGIIQQVQTRVSNTQWDKGDVIGVSAAGKTNVEFVTANGDGNFEGTLWLLGGDAQTVTAYYPYSETVTADNTVISFESPEDYMWASVPDVTRDNPQADLQFAHKMSKLSFTITNKAVEEGKQTTGTIKVTGAVVSGTFDTVSGVVTTGTTTGSVSADFTLSAATGIILPPQTTTSDLMVEITYNGKFYQGSFSAGELMESNQYNYTIDLAAIGESTQLTISSSTISGWTPNDKGDIGVTETELPLVYKEAAEVTVGDYLLTDGHVIDAASSLSDETKSRIAGVVFYTGNEHLTAYESVKNNAPFATYMTCTTGLAVALNNANEEAAKFATKGKVAFGDFFIEGKAIYSEESVNYFDPGFAAKNTTSLPLSGFNTTLIYRLIKESDEEEVDFALNALDDYIQSVTFESNVTVSGWYLPSYAELMKITEAVAMVKASVEKAGGSLISYPEFDISAGDNAVSAGAESDFYWSTDTRNASLYWASPLVPDSEVNAHVNVSKPGWFRPIVAFTASSAE
jgi:hypothetical protein